MGHMPHIVLVEDHQALREVTASILQEEGYKVTALAFAEDLQELVAGDPVDIFILDLNLPGEDGLSLTRRLRTIHPSVGILIVTARNSSSDIAIGYDSGADIYITKPVTPEALKSAVASVLRRIQRESGIQQMQLDIKAKQLHGELATVILSDRETQILTTFARANEQILEFGQLANLCGMNEDDFKRSRLDVGIARLRKKLKEAGGDKADIEAIRLTGYRLVIGLQII